MKQQLGIIVVLLVIVGIFLGYQTISKQVATVPSQTQLAQVVVPSTSGLVGYYTLNEGSGGTANDTSGNNNTGNVSGASWTTGKIAGGLNFNGTSNFVSIPDSSSLDITGAGTIATWINPSINRWNGVFAKGNVNDDGKSYNYAMEIKNDNHVVCVFGNGTTNNAVTSTATITANQLTHVACTWDGSSFKLYVNGTLNASASQTITPSANSSPLYLGKFGGNADYLQGVLDEVRIYNRSLSTSEIQDLYNYTGEVTPPSIPPQIYSFSASPSSTVSGQAVELAWTTLPTSVSSCTLSGDGPTKSVPISTRYYETQRLTTTTTFTLTCTGIDGTQVSKSATVTVSANAPTISNINVSNITTSGATISWTTNLQSDTQIEYGLTSTYGSQTPRNSLLVTSHSQTISGLTANTVYHYKVKSSNGVLTQSADQTFATTPPVATGQTLLTTQIPTLMNISDGVGVNYELGTRFQSNVAGNILAIRFWKSSKETGTHTGRVWSASGTQLASVIFTSETASGWQQQSLAIPLVINANTEYMVSVNTGSTYYAVNNTGFANKITSGNLSSMVGGNGRYGGVNAYPTQTYISSNYFRDIVFSPTGTPPPVTNYTVTVSKLGTGTGTVTCNPVNCSVTPGSSITLTATPASGSSFTAWSNAGSCVTATSCTFTPTANTTVIATFTSNLINPTVSITANPTSITSGGTSNISWTSANATSCSVTKAGSAWQTGLTGTNISSGVLTANTIFTVTCTGASGTTPANASATVTVNPVITGNTYYIRSGATGASCTDWGTNACNALPATLVRGATYYIADGTYGSYIFDDPEISTQVITIKKATIADHGTGTGWINTYGDGQANFTELRIRTDYYLIDGQKRNENNWQDSASYGFAVPDGFTGWSATGSPDHITVKYVDIGGTGTCSGNTCNVSDAGFYLVGPDPALTDWTISRVHIHNVKIPIQLIYVENIIVEYSWLGPSWSKETIRGQYRALNVTVRNNITKDACQGNPAEPTATSCTADIAFFGNQNSSGDNYDNAKIYGNLFWLSPDVTFNAGRSDACIMLGDTRDPLNPGTSRNSEIYNNTFVGVTTNSCSIRFPGINTGSIAKNNIWYGLGSGVDYSCSAETCSNNGLVTSASQFVNAVQGNFHLAQALVGAILNSSYNTDIDGNTRGADGVWDRGTYEYTGTPPASTGSIMTKLVGSDLTTATAPAGVVSKVDTGATTATNPATFPSLSVASHIVYATDATGYTESYATCTYPEGGTECTVTGLPSYTTVGLTCASSFCSVSVPVTANTVTKTIFKYAAVVANSPPTVSITSPINGATYTAPALITINATASDSDGTISSVAFYNGTTLLGTDTTSPYSYSWTGVAVGTYSLTARATDNSGAQTTSSAVTVTVNPVATGSTYYIRSGATGNGSDWTNALNALPATLVRGATYYIADGSYGAYTFDDPVSGTQLITIKKATIAGHGIATGWLNTYGDGQAVFTALEFTSSNWLFDGQTRNESDWFDKTAYGFSVEHNSEWASVFIAKYGVRTDNVTLKYTYILALVGNLSPAATNRYCISTDNNTGEGAGSIIGTGHVFSRVFCDGGTQHWFVRNSEAPVIEYSASDRITGDSGHHGENINLYYTGDNSIIRYNKFRNSFMGQGSTPAGGGTAIIAIAYTGGHQIYGNTVYNYQAGNGVIGGGFPTLGNIKIHNNTFVNNPYGAPGISLGSGTGNDVYNNLWINTAQTPDIAGATHNYNGFSGSASLGEANQQLNIPTSIFTNYAGNDFTLKTNTIAGTPLPAPYNIDPLGRIRATWSRGAYEYTAPL